MPVDPRSHDEMVLRVRGLIRAMGRVYGYHSLDAAIEAELRGSPGRKGGAETNVRRWQVDRLRKMDPNLTLRGAVKRLLVEEQRIAPDHLQREVKLETDRIRLAGKRATVEKRMAGLKGDIAIDHEADSWREVLEEVEERRYAEFLDN